MFRLSLITYVFVVLLLPGPSRAHDNKYVHPFSLTGVGSDVLDNRYGNAYIDLRPFYNKKVSEANGYHPDTNFNPFLCKIGTQGTIREDEVLLPENRLPFLNHYWTPWGNHDTWWAKALFTRNAVEYAREVFDEGVMHFADGLEEAAFFDFGRTMHLMEDMGSVPHVFSDSHPSLLQRLNSFDSSGYEKWCYAHKGDLGAPASEVPVTSLEQGMQALALEAFRSSRISGRLSRDQADPVSGDLAELFPDAERIAYVPPSLLHGHVEYWWLQGVGANFFGEEPTWPNREAPQAVLPFFDHNSWVRIPNLPGENGVFFYIENGQDTVVPTKVWSVSAGAWVPNTSGLTLAQLWAGAGDFRATPAQEHELIPRTTAYVAGYMKHVWDFVNPPPHLVGVRIEQDRNADGRIDAEAGEVLYDKAWRTDAGSDEGPRTRRRLDGRSHPASRLPVRITLRFSEPVRHVRAALEARGASLPLLDDAASERGPPTAEFPDGEPFVTIPAVDLAALPDGTATLSVNAQDLSNHVGTGCEHLDPLPSSRAGRLPDGSWRWYLEEGAASGSPDRTHAFEIGGFEIRARPALRSLAPGTAASHTIELKNLTLPTDTEVVLALSGSAPGWTTNASDLGGVRLRLPAAASDWYPISTTLRVTATQSAVGDIEIRLAAQGGGLERSAAVRDWVARSPNPDHPDDLESVADPRFPTPWLVDPRSPVGLLLGGWGQGLGHLLGGSGIATAPVTQDLEPADGSAAGLSSLKALFIGSGGLAGIAGSPSLREKLAAFVARGGLLVAFTPQRGSDLAALPGSGIAGYGWSEDQACFGEAVTVAGRHPVLSGQDRAVLDAGADGYLTRWPDDAQVLLRRTSNSQPAMIRYRHGDGEVLLLTLYPDFGYGTGQSSAAERTLVRDLGSYALSWPEPIATHSPGDHVSLEVVVRNGTWLPAASLALEAGLPGQAPFLTQTLDRDLPPGGFAAVPMQFGAPASLGIHGVGYRLRDAAGAGLQRTDNAAHFAVQTPVPVPGAAESGIRLWVTAPSDTVPRGGTAEALVHIRNATGRDFSGLVAATWTHLGEGAVHVAPPVVVPARGESAVPLTFSVPDVRPFSLVFGIFEGEAAPPPREFFERAAAHAFKGFHVFSPAAGIELQASSAIVMPGEPFDVAVLLRNLAGAAFPLRLDLRLTDAENAVLWSVERDISLGAGAQTERFQAEISGGLGGELLLEARATARGEIVGLDVVRLRLPRARLTVTPRLQPVWRSGGDNYPAFLVRNSGELPVEAALLVVSLAGPDGRELASASAPVSPLAPGSEAEVTVPLTLPPLPLGSLALRYAATHPGGRTAGTRLIRHHATVEIAAEPARCVPGADVVVTATVRGLGDVAAEGRLTVSIPSLSFVSDSPAAIAPGSAASVTLAVPVPESVLHGTHKVQAELAMVDVVTAAGAFVVPPARLDVLQPPADANAGERIAFTVGNTGESAGIFDYTLRLTASAIDPGDPSAPTFAEASGDLSLGAGEERTLSLAVPAGIASGSYALGFSAQERYSGSRTGRRFYILVHGLSAVLEVRTDAAAYAPGEPVTPHARVEALGPPVDGATLRLTITGSGGIDPPPFAGTVYVSPAGDDAGGDGTLARPYASPQRGLDAAAPGDRVLLLAGAYGGGTIAIPRGVVLQGEVIGGVPATQLDGVDLAAQSGTAVDHLTIRDGSVQFTDGAAGVRVTDCTFVGGARTLPGLGQGIVFAGAAADVLVGRNRLEGFRGWRAGVHFLGPAVRAFVHGNRFERFESGGNAGVHFWGEAREVVVQENGFTGFAGGCDGVHFWGGSGALAGLRILNNRFSGMAGGSAGVHLWRPVDAVTIRGNRLEDVAGNAAGIHLWYAARTASVSDNTLQHLRGDVAGIHLWGATGEELLAVEVENNRLEDVGPSDGLSRDNGILVWGRMRGLRIARNVLRRVSDGEPAGQSSGIVLREGGSGVEISRNVVAQSDAGIALRPPYSAGRAGHRIEAVVANNLLLEDGVGILEETVQDGGASDLRDNIIAGARRAGIIYLSGSGLPAASRCRANDLTGNALNAEGRPDPVGFDGNFSADPLLADAAAGDYRLLAGSPCAGAGSIPPLDVGPLEDDLRVVLGPRPVPPAVFETVHWLTELPVRLPAGSSESWTAAAGPVDAAGSLFLRGRLLSAAGQVLAESASPFSIRSEPVLLVLSTPRDTYRPGETIPVVVDATNTAADPQQILLRVTSAGTEVLVRPLALAPGETASVPFETSAEVDCILHAEAGLASAELPLAIAEPRADVTLVAPGVVGAGPFTIVAHVANVGGVPIGLTLTLDGDAHPLSLAPGEERAFSKTCSISADTTFLALLEGDASGAATATVRFGPRPGVSLDALPFYAAGPISVPVVLSNAGSVGARVGAVVTLSGAAAGIIGTWGRESWLEGGDSSRQDIALGALAPGDYVLRAEAGPAAAEVRFRVTPAVAATICGVEVGGALDSGGLLPVNVCLRNWGALRFEGTLAVQTPFAALEQDVGLDAGTETLLTILLDVRELAPGDYAAAATLSVGGDIHDRHEFPIPLRAALALTSLPADLWLPPGLPSEIRIGARNTGTARAVAALTVSCGDFLDETRALVLGPGQGESIAFTVTIPADLPSSTPCSALAELTDLGAGTAVSGDFLIGVDAGFSPYLSGELDKPAYRNGETAGFLLSLGGDAMRPKDLRILVSHGEYRTWRDATVAGGPTFSSVYPAYEPGGLGLLPWAGRGTYTSSALDVGDSAGMLASWMAETPPGSAVLVETRSGPTAVPDQGWTPWSAVERGGQAAARSDRFLQYRVTLSATSGAQPPFVSEIRFERPGAERVVRHRTHADFAHSPIGFLHPIPVDFSAGDRVFFGAYEDTGRSIFLDFVPIRRANGDLVLWTDLPFYSICDTVTVTAQVGAGGTLELRTPWESATRSFDGPATASFAFTVPEELRSGTYFIEADFAGSHHALPVEVYGYGVSVLAATLDRSWYLPGEHARLEVELDSDESLEGVTAEVWASGAGESRLTASEVIALDYGRNRLAFEVPIGAGAAGPATLEILLFKRIGADARALLLAGAWAAFDLLAPNSAPAAVAGPDRAVAERSWVQLDGSASSDPDGDELRWAWRQTAGPPALIYGGGTANPLVLAPEVGRPGAVLSFALTVSDGLAGSPADIVEVFVTDANRAPVAHAGTDFTRAVGERAALDGSQSFDPDGDPLVFRWEFAERPPGSAAALDDASALAPSFVVDLPGDYEIRLAVSDGLTESVSDAVRVSTVNSRPTADAGPDATARPGARVALSGEGSFDPDGDALAFLWVLVQTPEGSIASLDDPTAAAPSFAVDRCGRYVAELRVHDGQLESEPDLVAIDCANARPTADAGPDQAVRAGQGVTLDGTGSSDPDGDQLRYRWAFTALPDGSAASLDGEGSAQAGFQPDVAGTYALSLVVSDGATESDPDGVVVSVGPDLAPGVVTFKPAGIRKSAPPKTVLARVELSGGFSSAEIDPALAAVTAVGTRTLPRPVLPVVSKGAVLADADRDGLPELAVHYPVKPLLRFLKAGAKNRLTLKGPLATWGRFVGTGVLKVAP